MLSSFFVSLLLLVVCATTSPIAALVSNDFQDCRDLFFKSTPPTRRRSCKGESCKDLCVGDSDAFYYASRANLDLGAPEFSAHFLTYKETLLAKKNNHRRPAWKPNKDIPVEQQYPTSNVLWNGNDGPYDKGHLVSKENLDYSKEASDSTFVMTNVIPELDSCNQQEWNRLEADVRNWVLHHKRDLYVVVAVGYQNYNQPRVLKGIVVPDYVAMLLCDPVAKKSVAIVGEPYNKKCGAKDFFYQYRTVREVEEDYLNENGLPIRVFDDECKPCELDNSHWFGEKYADGKSTPQYCSSSEDGEMYKEEEP